jgi:hypothetical protein
MAKDLRLYLAAAVLLFAAGCSTISTNSPAPSITGNWAFTAPPPQNAPAAVTLNAGFTESTSGTVSAVAHLTGTSCLPPTTGIVLSGSVGSNNNLALTSQPFAGTTLSLNGQLATAGTVISGATWSFSGGSCAALGSATVTATHFDQIDGTYTGNFVDSGNNQLAVSATLTQTTQPVNGQYQLSGSASFPGNPCFTQPIVTNSLVTGSSLSTTYTDQVSGAVIVATGTFNSTATQLTVTNWQVTGGLCDGDTGTGFLSEPD